MALTKIGAGLFKDTLKSSVSGALGDNATTIRNLTSAGITGSFSPASASISTRLTTAESELSNTLISSSVLSSPSQGTIRLATNGVNTDVDSGLQTSDSVQFSSVQADGGVTVDNITIDGTEIDLSSGDLTVDVEGDIILDANGADIKLKDDGTEFGRFSRVSSDLVIKSISNNNDILFKGVDGSSTITALQLDMSEAGNAIFNNDVTIAGTLTAQEIHTEFTSASIMFSSGSTKFGDTIDDTHEVTGSMTMSGSVTVNDGDLSVIDSVGIGTNNPTVALEVFGSADQQIRIDSTGNRAQLQFDGKKTSDAEFAEINFANDGDSAAAIHAMRDGANDAARLAFFTQATGGSVTERMTIDSDGKIGVNTTTMDAHVNINSGATNAGLHVESTDSNANISMADNAGSVVIAAAGNEFIVETGGTASTAGSSAGEAFRIDDQGRVGITTNNPGNPLHIHSDTYPQLNIDGTDNSGNIGFVLSGSGGRGGMRWNGSNNDVEILREGGGVEISLLDGGGTTFASEVFFQGGGNYTAEFQGDVKILDNNSDPRLLIGDSTSANEYGEISYDSSENTLRLGVQGDESTITLNTSSQALFAGGSASDPSISFSGDDDTGIYNGGVGAITFMNNGNRSLELQSSLLAEFSGDIRLNGDDTKIQFNTSGASGHPAISMDSNAAFSFLNTSGGTNVIITNGGNLGINDSSPSLKLSVDGGSSADIARFHNDSNSTGITIGYSTNLGSIDLAASQALRIRQGGSTPFLLNTNGVMDGDFNDTSDKALKKDIKDLEKTLESVNKIKPSTFKWKEETKSDEKQIGFIAQDVEKYFPELVHGEEGTKSINTLGVVSVLMKAVQELSKENDDLKKRMEALENN